MNIHRLASGYDIHSSPWYRWPIEIDGLAIKNGDFPWRTVSHNQMVAILGFLFCIRGLNSFDS